MIDFRPYLIWFTLLGQWFAVVDPVNINGERYAEHLERVFFAPASGVVEYVNANGDSCELHNLLPGAFYSTYDFDGGLEVWAGFMPGASGESRGWRETEAAAMVSTGPVLDSYWAVPCESAAGDTVYCWTWPGGGDMPLRHWRIGPEGWGLIHFTQYTDSVTTGTARTLGWIAPGRRPAPNTRPRGWSDVDTSTVAFYDFDDGTAADSTGRFDGTVRSGGFTTGQSGLSLSGVVDLPPIPLTGDTTIVSADVRPAGGSNPEGRVISQATDHFEQTHYLMISRYYDQWRARLKVDGVTHTLIGGVCTEAQWQNVALSYDGAQIRLLVDGVEVAWLAVSGALTGSGGATFAIGNQPPGARDYPLVGEFDNVTFISK